MRRAVMGGTVVLVGLVLAAGCGGGKPTPVPVSGVLKVDGKPVPGAVVTFEARDAGGRDAHGTVGPDGTFRLTTNTPGDGAFPGQYRVYIQPPAAGGATPFDDPNQPATRRLPAGVPRIPEKYTRPDQTPLTQDVPAAGEVVFDLKTP